MKKALSPRAQLILSMLIFGTIGVLRRSIPFPSSVVALVRAVIGLAYLLILRAVRHQPVDRAAVRRNLGKLLILGAMLAANWIFLFEAYNYTSVAAATMCYYMCPVFVILLSPFLFGEKITLRKGLCALVAVFGMVLVSDVLSSGLHGAKGLSQYTDVDRYFRDAQMLTIGEGSSEVCQIVISGKLYHTALDQY